VPLSDDELRDTVRDLLSRPKHEKVRLHISNLLVQGLGARNTELHFEYQLPEVHGRADALLGRTVLSSKAICATSYPMRKKNLGVTFNSARPILDTALLASPQMARISFHTN
jgi:hypothetical protein